MFFRWVRIIRKYYSSVNYYGLDEWGLIFRREDGNFSLSQGRDGL
jgi:hypothetical protein